MADASTRGHLDLALLVAVRSGPAHGYEIIRRVADGSGGNLEFAEGTVYPALHRLERSGLLESEWDEAGGRGRRVYAITGEGRSALAVQRKVWARFATGMQLLLGGAR